MVYSPRGTTSACAENTHPYGTPTPTPRNYLRMRGEYPYPHRRRHQNRELPPHARRILSAKTLRETSYGTTSACAENTHYGDPRSTGFGNYLRMRGEYSMAAHLITTRLELPPHARRILRELEHLCECGGTTSACAENTRPRLFPRRAWGNYLRMRGEYHCDGKTFL